MKKIIAIVTAAMLGVTSLVGCGDAGSTDSKKVDGSNKLVVYSPNTEDIINTIIPMFEDETGIDVEMVSAGTGELFKRVQSEKNNPYADVIFGGSRAQFAENEDLFEKYVSKNDGDMMEGHRNTTGYMTSYVADGSVILVNKNLIGDIKIEGYKDLLNPKLKGKIAAADPTSSSSAFAHLTDMLRAIGGDYTSDAGWDYVKSLVQNLDGKIASGSGAVHKSVADGEYTVGLTYEDPAASYVKSGADVEIVYPKEGTVFLDATSGIVKNAPDMENAKKFIDFITSQKAQDAFGSQLTNRPLRKDAKLGDYMTPMSKINIIQEDCDYVASHKSEIVQKYTEVATSAK
ncbi:MULTISPECIES: ABC transporter substrate-binding protein [Clostridium]|uniref:Iron ABC transporter substrate-binding protein n=1 Tax=Clostridium beijerinckii TaxID=1520 RepID=A0A1S9NC15_CLOBE|nr:MULTISPECIES: ABC transporter substrate-binding protein [Clostridium]MBN7573523.1 extracellular solute-binding protein [Clostridium beijerinckii]MBN7579130.1 extracellular solute-binding protein [Clostridium beijerinckii]MBN7583566.1 extracellular solute-binding protein [Clostridium beijerinckii]MBO0519761.1 extracellular solute-binding protein [Clostridium beijerinckii]MZK51269.1 extracellular solute-binding protein [Clostridium beijerinckii]